MQVDPPPCRTDLPLPAGTFGGSGAVVVAAGLPGALLMIGAITGGIPVAGALVAIAAVVPFLDRLAPAPARPADGRVGGLVSESLVAGLAIMMLMILPLAVHAVTGGSDHSALASVALFIGAALYLGQVGNAVAHELIHTTGRFRFRLGEALFTALLFGHHVSAHRLVHHSNVASDDDPNSARRGEGFYRFVLRAWAGSFIAGYRAERALGLRRHRWAGRSRLRTSPYAIYLAGGALWITAMGMAFGAHGIGIYLALCGLAQGQILLSDYVQHYGLRRTRLASGKLEPVGPIHSWDSRQVASAAMLLNAPRHSDHHVNPARPFPELGLPREAPLLPFGLPTMAAIALVPPLWRRVMDPRLDRHCAGTVASRSVTQL